MQCRLQQGVLVSFYFQCGAGMGRTTLFIFYKGNSGCSKENAFRWGVQGQAGHLIWRHLVL